jgi:SAM-dependent methyltransferase
MGDHLLPAEVFDGIYQRHITGERHCVISVTDIVKARYKVKQIWDVFKLSPITDTMTILDIGCGLGYVSEALRQAGGRVLGIDSSKVAIQCAMESFPSVDFECLSFSEQLQKQRKFDVIWALDLSLICTYDVDFINEQFIKPCSSILNENGIVIMGWHSNFSGKMINNWAHWDMKTINKIKNISGLTGPRVVEYRSKILSAGIIRICRIIKKTAPIYFVKKST